MTLTLGMGPLAPQPAGEFNFDLKASAPGHRIYLAADQRRLRAIVGDAVILDTTRARLLHETAIMPRIYAPLEDYAIEAHFTQTQTTTHCPFKGDASYWSLKVGDRSIEDMLWAYPNPIEALPGIEGLGALYEDKVDAWFVEDDRVVGHLKDPFHRVDTHDSSRETVVTVNGTEVARSPRPKLVFETGLPVRVYVPPADIDAAAVAPGSGQRSVCAYKGEATHWTIAGVQDAAWSYETPLPDALRAQGHLCFDESVEGVQVTLADR